MESPSDQDSSEKSNGQPESPRKPPRVPGPPDKQKMTVSGPSSGLWLFIALILAVMFMISFYSTKGSQIDLSFMYEQGEKGNIEYIEFTPLNTITGKWKKDKIPDPPDPAQGTLKEVFEVHTIPNDPSLPQKLEQWYKDNKIERFDSAPIDTGFGTQLLISLGMVFLLIGFLWFIMRRSADPMGPGMMGNFTRSPAKRFSATDKPQTFNDVAGMEHAKTELTEVVDFLKNPKKFEKMGAQIPRGILLKGPPGTGKTLMARATAGEAGVPFFSVNGSEFIQMFVGVGASRVRDLFKTARENAPCILFIDEIDAVGRERGAGLGGGHDEREQTLNQILSEMDGFQPNDAAIVLAATNRPDILDPALLRPGRFDRHVTIDRPTKDGRIGILKVHIKKVPLADDVDLERVAAGTIGFSGAELKNLVNEAALHATRANRNSVTMDDFESARDKVLMGAPRENILQGHERDMTAYHEAGHALLAWLLPEVDSVHKVTIIPRGWSLGLTQLVPDEESYNVGEKTLHSQLAMIMGGRAAEKLIFDEYTAGAQDDLKKATKTARRMVANWGMSDVVGPVAFDQREVHPFLGKEMHEQKEYSEQTARILDEEVQRILREADQLAMDTLTQNRDKLDSLAKELLEKESLGTEELTALLGESAQSVHRSEPSQDGSA